MNWGDLRGEGLYAQVHSLLQNVCPWSDTNLCPGSPQDPTIWLDFTTNTPISDSQAESKVAWLRILDGQWSSPEARNIMIELAARTLEAYVSQDEGYNCYEQSGKVYCNVPRYVRVSLYSSTIGLRVLTIVLQVNLPWDDRTHDRQINAMHVETWGTVYGDQFADVSPKGSLQPCKTRPLVDKVMDSMKDDLVKEFPDWKDRFSREARVIIDSYRVCTDEP